MVECKLHTLEYNPRPIEDQMLISQIISDMDRVLTLHGSTINFGTYVVQHLRESINQLMWMVIYKLLTEHLSTPCTYPANSLHATDFTVPKSWKKKYQNQFWNISYHEYENLCISISIGLQSIFILQTLMDLT